MDRTVQQGPRPHLPMTAELQQGDLAQGSSSSSAPQHEKASQGDSTGNARSGSCGNVSGSKHLRRFFGLCQHDSEKSGSNIPAAQKGTNSSEPEYEDVPLAILTRGVQVSQPASNKPAATKKVTTERTGQDNQQGQSSTQGSQQQRRRATQAGPDGSESSEFTFRGGDTGNCVREPCGCCAYWINKICCGDDD